MATVPSRRRPSPRGAAAVPAPIRRRAAEPAQPLLVVATHKVRRREGVPPYAWVPYGTEHAWVPGTRRTLCGEWTAGWDVFWDLRFSAGRGASCHACIEASLPAASRRRLDPVGAPVPGGDDLPRTA